MNNARTDLLKVSIVAVITVMVWAYGFSIIFSEFMKVFDPGNSSTIINSYIFALSFIIGGIGSFVACKISRVKNSHRIVIFITVAVIILLIVPTLITGAGALTAQFTSIGFWGFILGLIAVGLRGNKNEKAT